MRLAAVAAQFTKADRPPAPGMFAAWHARDFVHSRRMQARDRKALPPLARIAAAAVALVAWTGLGIQLQASAAHHDGSLGAALWAMLRFFTIIANLLLALQFGAIALGSARAAAPRLLGGMTLTILLVGAVYMLLLRGLEDELNAGVALVGVLLHEATPALAALFWLAFARKGRLGRADPLRWTALPLAYLGYALARGAVEGTYPYPFIDVASIGWARTLANSAAIAAGFVAAGYALVGVDRLLARRADGPR